MASTIPKWVKKEICDGWAAEALWLMLLKDTYTPSATHRYVSDVVSHEITDSGSVYVSGGLLIDTPTSQPDGDNYYLDAADKTIGPGATLNYKYAVIYTKTGGTGQATYKIRAIIEFATNQIVTNGTSVIMWNALGIIYVS